MLTGGWNVGPRVEKAQKLPEGDCTLYYESRPNAKGVNVFKKSRKTRCTMMDLQEQVCEPLSARNHRTRRWMDARGRRWRSRQAPFSKSGRSMEGSRAMPAPGP